MNAAPALPRSTAASRMREQTGSDKRYKILAAHIKKHLARQDALIEVLHKAQELFGYLDDNTLRFVAWKLKLPPSRVSGVATFYHYFKLKAQGAHTCVVCLGTACYVKGADQVLAAVEKSAGVKAGGRTADGKVSVFTARCIGACGIAPAAVFDDVVAPRQTPETARERIETWVKS